MDTLKLGPNGALVYCMEFLETNFDWLVAQIKKFPKDKYFIFDLPGQVNSNCSGWAVVAAQVIATLGSCA